MTRRALFWLVIVAILALPVAGLELALRWIGLGDPIVYYTNLTYRYAPMPGQKVTRFDGAVITINRHGLRSTEEWDAPADLRVLFIGDSVTWGTSWIDDADTFSERTCALLEAALRIRATCGNAGVNAYGSDNMARRIRDKGFDDEDWLVIVLLSGDLVRSLQTINAGHFHMNKPSGPLRATWEAVNYGAVRLSRLLRGRNYRPAREMRIARDSLRNLLDVAGQERREGKQVLIVLTYGERELLGTGAGEALERDRALSRLVRREVGASGLPLLDLFAAMKRRYRPGFFLDGTHLGVLGNRIVAAAIAERIAAAERPSRRR